MDEVQKQPENQTLEAPPKQNLNQAKPVDTQPAKPKRKIPMLKILVAGIVILFTLMAFGLITYLLIDQNKTRENQIVETEISEPTPTPDPTADWKTYSASYDSFSFKYPSNLEILEDKYNGKTFRTFVENGDIQLVIHPDGLTGESSLNAYRNNVETVGANNFSSYKISGEEALKYNVIAKGEETIEIITMHNGKTYLITYSYTNPEQIQYLDQILSTFKFTDSKSETSMQNYLDIPEFGVKIPLSDATKDAYYTIKTINDGSFAEIKVHSLDSEPYCNDGSSGLASLTKIEKYDGEHLRFGSWNELISSNLGTLIGNNYYILEFGQAVCSQNTTSQALEQNARKALRDISKNITEL